MLIWKGYGFLVFIAALIFVNLFGFISTKIGCSGNIGAGGGFLISAVAVYLMGRKLDNTSKSKTYIDKATGRETTVAPQHSLFFIKMEYWAYVLGALGLLLLVRERL